jgi:hypothetical protein
MTADQQQRIAEAVLGCTLEPGGFCPCPGAHRHTTRTGRRDFQIIFDPTGQKMPSARCFHGSCEPERREAMVAIIRAIRAAEREEQGGAAAPRQPQRTQPRYSQVQPSAERPQLPEATARITAQACPVPNPDRAWLRSISPTCIPADPARWAELLLDSLYRRDDRILIFTEFKSQGQFLRVIHGKNYQLSPTPGRKARPAGALPARAHDGAWFLTSPVVGSWCENPNNRAADGSPRLGRRHAACCTRFPFAVLESDILPEDTWLLLLAQLRDPIVAVYTSGGKSIHALVRVDAATPAEFNLARRRLLHRLTPLGADPAAITAVRLSRLPGCLRESKNAMQELLYLNPHPQPGIRLADMPRRR